MFQLASINKQFNTASESFQTSFRLTHKGNQLFSHEFDAGAASDVLIGKDTFVVKNHFFTTGEELTYEAYDGRPVGLSLIHI